MTQSDAATSRTEVASIDDQANYVPTVYIIGYVITVLAITWTSIGLAASAGISIKLYDPWHGIVFSNLTMLIPTIIAVVFNTLQRKPAPVQLRPLTRHITAKSVIFAVAFPLVFIVGIAALCLVMGFGTLNSDVLGAAFLSMFLFISIVATVILFPFGFGEEYGWRAYLLPALTVRYGTTRATALVGLVWGFWHLALWMYAALAASASPLDVGIHVGVNFAAAFALSFPFAYCYFLSGNVLPCVLLHVLFDNFLIFVFGANNGLVLSGDFMIFQAIGFFALIPVFIWQFKRMGTPWLPNNRESPYEPAEPI